MTIACVFIELPEKDPLDHSRNNLDLCCSENRDKEKTIMREA